jgi:hypothetical protein
MSLYADNHDPRATKEKTHESQPHTALGAHDVPLLDHRYPPLKFARRHHAEVPHRDEPGYTHYKAARDGTLANAVRTLEKELGARCAVEHIQLESTKLIVRYSQSKLSQQELADLQKATHFDKKELQQWYKGVHSSSSKGRWSYC